MIKELIEKFKEDPTEFIGGVCFMIGWVLLTWFLFWFGSMFMYDM